MMKHQRKKQKLRISRSHQSVCVCVWPGEAAACSARAFVHMCGRGGLLTCDSLAFPADQVTVIDSSSDGSAP